MVRAILSPHGLNDDRGERMSACQTTQQVIQSHAAAKGDEIINVVWCQNGTHPDGKTPEHEFDGTMRRFLRRLLPRHQINVEEFKFEETSISNADRQRGLAKLQCCDIFYMRGTWGMPDRVLADIVMNSSYEEAVLILQYKVLFNHTLYMGICGGAMLASDTFDPTGFVGLDLQGLGLLGKQVTIHYDDWRDPSLPHGIRFNNVVYTVIDTTQNIWSCQVLTKKKNADKMAEYARVASQMTQNLQQYARTLNKDDLYRTHTGRLFSVNWMEGTWTLWPWQPA